MLNSISMKHWLQLIRWNNLALLALTLVLIKFLLFDASAGLEMSLNTLHFSLFVIATLCIAAGGYIINDIQDVETDSINKEKRLVINKYITEDKAFYAYAALTIIGVGIGFYVANYVGRAGYAAFFILIAAILYLYSTSLKQIPVIGNVIVAVLVAFSILLLGILDLIPVINESNRGIQMTFLQLLLDFAVFAFLINLVRELVKDIEDIDGDFNAEMKTLPILIGRERAGKIAFVLALLPLAAVIYYLLTYLYKQQLAIGYFLVFIIAPLIYVAVKSFTAEVKKDWSHISLVLKWIMLFGVLSVVIFKFMRM